MAPILLKSAQMRNRKLAWPTPGRPEFHDVHFAVGHVDLWLLAGRKQPSLQAESIRRIVTNTQLVPRVGS